MATPQRPPVIDEALAQQLDDYRGRWVAVHNGKVIASGTSANEAVDQALKAGVTDPLVFRVSSHPERVNLL